MRKFVITTPGQTLGPVGSIVAEDQLGFADDPEKVAAWIDRGYGTEIFDDSEDRPRRDTEKRQARKAAKAAVKAAVNPKPLELVRDEPDDDPLDIVAEDPEPAESED